MESIYFRKGSKSFAHYRKLVSMIDALDKAANDFHNDLNKNYAGPSEEWHKDLSLDELRNLSTGLKQYRNFIVDAQDLF